MKKISILSLDDDPSFNQLLKARLQSTDFEITSVTSTKEYIRLFQEKSWDISLIDMNLEEGSEAGFQVVRYLRENLKVKIPLLLLSRNDASEKITHALECGASDYLSKPFDLELFKSKVNYLLSDEMLSQSNLQTLPVPSLYRSACIEVGYTPITVSESGMTLKGRDFLSKGIFVEMKNSYLNEVLERESIRLLVTKNARIDDEFFSHFLEFDPEDLSLQEEVRRWLYAKSGEVK